MKLNNATYIRKYLELNYPMYYRAVSKQDMAKFVNAIGSHSLLRKFNVVDGDADAIIDQLAETYAQTNLTSIYANFDALTDYIKKVIYKREGKIEMNDETFSRICVNVALELTKDFKTDDDYNSLKDSSYDTKIYEEFMRQFKANFDEVCMYVKSVITSNASLEQSRGVDDKTYEYLVEELASETMKKHYSVKLLMGVHDADIIRGYNAAIYQMEAKVRRYVEIYLNTKLDAAELFMIDSFKIVDGITEKAIKKGEICALDLINGKLNKYIYKYAMSNKTKKVGINYSDVVQYVYNYITSNNSLNLPDLALMAVSREIIPLLHDNYNAHDSDIISGKCNDLIGFEYTRTAMKYSSVRMENVPSMVEYKPKKKSKDKMFKNLIIMGLLVSLTGGAAFEIGKVVVDGIGDKLAANYVRNNLDKFDYSSIFTSGTDAFEPTALNAITFYSNVKQFDNENYNYLGFYTAYNNVRDDRLDIMDSMLSVVKYRIRSSDNSYGSFGSNVCSYTCFLDLVFEQLDNMGCEKIHNDKYEVAISAYKREFYAEGKGTPYDRLDSKTQQVIEEIMSMYREYSSKELANLGKEAQKKQDNSNGVDDSAPGVSTLSNSNGGRKI